MAQSESASVQLPLPLSNRETTVLELYDSLQQLRMEIALINARTRLEAGTKVSLAYYSSVSQLIK